MSSMDPPGAEEVESAAGTPLTHKGRATRARIVAVASDLISERGVNNTSIEDVRRAARVSGSQMSHYFQDKHSLVQAVIANRLDVVLDFHTRPELGKLDSFAALRLWADLSVESLEADIQKGCAFGSLAGELVKVDPALRTDLAAGYQRWSRILSVGLVAMRRRGELRPDAEPAVLTSVLLAAHQGGSLLSQTRGDSRTLRDALNAALVYVHLFAADGVQLPPPRRRPTARRARS
jgi:AcrR family transcriptional regulator